MNIDLTSPCEHLEQTKIRDVKRPGAGCEDCLKIGGQWVHLRTCLSCGHTSCCDDSPHRHATKHFHATKHPVIASAERGETWAWCFLDERVLSA